MVASAQEVLIEKIKGINISSLECCIIVSAKEVLQLIVLDATKF